MKLGLVSCTSVKRDDRCKAEEMYQPSYLFRWAWEYSKRHYDIQAILSAKHGLLLPDDVIGPYDETLHTKRVNERWKWAVMVIGQMEERLDLEKITDIYFHAGLNYRIHLIPLLNQKGIRTHEPLAGLSIGRQLSWYKQRRVDHG